MSYLEWFEEHAKKHKKIMQKLTHLSDHEVIEYFEYENMKEKERDFCPLYKKGKKCHDIDDLNCYLCACPNFRFNDEGFEILEDKSLKSFCNINSKDGRKFIGEKAIHQDCSSCIVPHKKNYIKKVFKRDWQEMMQSCLSMTKS